MDIYQHYRHDERLFLDQVFEWIQMVKDSYAFRLTDFLDPRQQEIVTQLANYDGEVNAYFHGGLEDAERKRGIIAPAYFEPKRSDYGLAFFELQYAVKFFTIEHSQLLGALMSLGLKREKFGDILINGQAVQFVVVDEIAKYVMLHLDSVGRAPVTLHKLSKDELIEPDDEWRSYTGTIPALRLDALLAEIFNISRSKAVTYIQKALVKINWKVVEQPSYECHIFDTISLRGFGRAKLQVLEGQTRKGKWRIQYSKKL